MEFIDLFMSTDWREAAEFRGIQHAQRSADAASFDASVGLDQVAKLAREHQAMRQELVRLQLMLATAFDALAGLGLINKEKLGHELDARLAQHKAAVEQAAHYVACAQCKKQVLKSRTNLTADGPVCDRCSTDQDL